MRYSGGSYWEDRKIGESIAILKNKKEENDHEKDISCEHLFDLFDADIEP